MIDLWNMDCTVRDLILWSAFTCEELEQVAQSLSCTLACGCGLPTTVGTMIAAHHATATPNRFSLRLQERLDDRASDAFLWLLSSPPEDVAEVARGALDDMPCELPTLLWVVARDGSHVLARARQILQWRLTMEGARQLAFGKVELIAV
ncbi:MAG: hypothetical protein AAF581_15735 [Planctomycetota bacterium]